MQCRFCWLIIILLAFGAVSSAQTETPKQITIAFLPQSDITTFLPDAEAMANDLSRRLGLPVKVHIPADFAAAVEAMRHNHAQVAYLPSWPGVMANRMAGARYILAEVRGGKTYYYSVWYVRKDANINSLTNLRGKRVAFSSPLSASGYLFAIAKLAEEGLLEDGKADPKAFFGQVFYSGGYEATMQALARGHVDAGAASDASYELYLTPEQRKDIKILTRQGPVPTFGIVVHPNLSAEFVKKFQQTLLQFNAEKDRALIRKLYGADSLTIVNHEEHVAPVYRAEQLTGFRYQPSGRR